MSILQLLGTSPVEALVFLLSIILAVTVHEFAHAWAADKLGDDTPRLQGRVTLSPAAHLDPLGSLSFLLLGFGWGKPVEYNPMRLPRKVDELLIALAGPFSNLVTAIVLNALALAFFHTAPTFAVFISIAAYLNVSLAAFNIIPIPPLDGSSIVAYFWPEYRSFLSGQVGLMVLLAFVFLPLIGGNTLLSIIVGPIRDAFSSLTHLFGLLPVIF